MKRNYQLSIILLSFLVLTLSGCKSPKKQEIENIITLEKAIGNSVTSGIEIDQRKAGTYIDACKKFADKYNSDTIAASYLFKAGRMAMSLREPEKADESVVLFDKLLKDFPKAKDAPLALFMKAFYIENNMKNLKMAEQTYREFLQKYPNNLLAADAQSSINNLGKPLDVIVKEFEAKHKDSIATAAKGKKK